MHYMYVSALPFTFESIWDVFGLLSLFLHSWKWKKVTDNSIQISLTEGKEGDEARQVHPNPELFILNLQIFDNDILSSNEDCYKSLPLQHVQELCLRNSCDCCDLMQISRSYINRNFCLFRTWLRSIGINVAY